MKKFWKRGGALVLALALTASLTRPARASWALGDELMDRTVPLAEGTSLTTQTLWSNSKEDLRTEHYVTYTPGGGVRPVVFSGTYVASTNTVAAAAAQMEAQGLRVTAAVNGGFFNTDGTIVGMLMTDGVLRALDVDNYALLGFTQDGRVFIDESKPEASAVWTGLDGFPRTFPLAGFNAYRNAGYLSGLYLYNKDFSSRVLSGGASVSAILRPMWEDGLRMNSSLTLQVVSVTDATQEGVAFNGEIPEGCYMLYAEDRENPELLAALRGLLPGSQVTVSVSGASGQWADAAFGLSGRHTLLRDGEIVTGLPTEAHPYTAVGLKADGSAIFYTIDGRQKGYSVGATYAQVAERLQELGCVSAVALDGGGSTTLGATLPGSESFSIVNRPSTADRRINNTILLVEEGGTGTGLPGGAYVTAERNVVLAGAGLAVSAAPYDLSGRPLPGAPLNWSASGGLIQANETGATYTAGAVPGVYAISAGGGGDMPVRVVDTLTSLTVSRKESGLVVESLHLEPGDQVELTASGSWMNLPVAMDEGNVAWGVSPEVGMIENGRFIAGPNSAEGTIVAAAGGLTITIPVKVDRGDPFTDMAGHWSSNYVTQLYKLGLTTGYGQEDGTALYIPDGQLTRAELLAFITRLLGVDPVYYEAVELPFADIDLIEEWALPYVKAMYTLGVLRGSENQGLLYADANSYITREETMTILGRVLAASQPCDLSQFPDAALVSDWALPHVQTLVALNVVGGSNGLLFPGDYIDRAAIAKLLVEVYPLEKALLLPRLDLMS